MEFKFNNFNFTILMFASANGILELVQLLLLQKHIDINAQSI